MRFLLFSAGLLLSLNAQARDLSLMSTSSAQMTNAVRFKAEICLADSVTGKSLANQKATVGRVHIYPSEVRDDKTYKYELEPGSSTAKPRTFQTVIDSRGCIAIADIIRLTSYESLDSAANTSSFRGPHDSIAEKIYGIKIGDEKTHVAAHVVFNAGIKQGHIRLEVIRP